MNSDAVKTMVGIMTVLQLILFVIPTNPVNIPFQLMNKDAAKIMVGILTALQYYLQYVEQHIIYFQRIKCHDARAMVGVSYYFCCVIPTDQINSVFHFGSDFGVLELTQ